MKSRKDIVNDLREIANDIDKFSNGMVPIEADLYIKELYEVMRSISTLSEK